MGFYIRVDEVEDAFDGAEGERVAGFGYYDYEGEFGEVAGCSWDAGFHLLIINISLVWFVIFSKIKKEEFFPFCVSLFVCWGAEFGVGSGLLWDGGGVIEWDRPAYWYAYSRGVSRRRGNGDCKGL